MQKITGKQRVKSRNERQKFKRDPELSQAELLGSQRCNFTKIRSQFVRFCRKCLKAPFVGVREH